MSAKSKGSINLHDESTQENYSSTTHSTNDIPHSNGIYDNMFIEKGMSHICEYFTLQLNNSHKERATTIKFIKTKIKDFVTNMGATLVRLAIILKCFGYFVFCKSKSIVKRLSDYMKKSIMYLKHNSLRRELTALAVLVLIIGSGIFAFSNYFDIGYKVVADGKILGTIKEKSDYYLALSLANSSVADSYGDEYVSSKNVTFEKSILPKGEFSSESALKQKAIAANENLKSSYVVNIDGVDLLSTKTKEVAEAILSNYKDKFRPQNCVELKFSNKIKITKKYAPKAIEKDTNSGVAYLESLNAKSVTVDNMSTNSAMNVTASQDSSVKAVRLSQDKKLTLEVVSIEKNPTEKPVAYATTTVSNPNVYEDVAPVVKTQGVNGKLAVEKIVTRVNGTMVEQRENGEKVIQNPINEVLEIGSKKRPTGIGTGKFIAPVHGIITSVYGPRKSGFHTGLDLAVSTGTPVEAADEGKVIFAGWDGNYGNLVIINHQNGFETYYAHNSSLVVAVGDIVAQGDIISYSGSTGNSTGPHCHFEVRKNGATQNPYDYIF